MKSGTKRKIFTGVGIMVAIVSLIAVLLPSIVQSLGLIPHYEGQSFDLAGKRALIVTTSHGILNAPGETTGDPTGVFASEMTVPYYEFSDANMQVDVASIRGGAIPIDPLSYKYFIKSDADRRYLKDEEFQDKVLHSLAISEVDFTSYDAVFFAGGWGAAYDFATSEELATKVSEAYYAMTPVIGSVCHGALALVGAVDTLGNPLIRGRTLTGVSNRQIQQLGIEVSPFHPETELKKAGANYQSNTAFNDLFANLTVVDEELRFVSGQNQNAGHETAQRMMQIIEYNTMK